MFTIVHGRIKPERNSSYWRLQQIENVKRKIIGRRVCVVMSVVVIVVRC